jgi:hypothetical protein
MKLESNGIRTMEITIPGECRQLQQNASIDIPGEKEITLRGCVNRTLVNGYAMTMRIIELRQTIPCDDGHIVEGSTTIRWYCDQLNTVSRTVLAADLTVLEAINH